MTSASFVENSSTHVSCHHHTDSSAGEAVLLKDTVLVENDTCSGMWEVHSHTSIEVENVDEANVFRPPENDGPLAPEFPQCLSESTSQNHVASCAGTPELSQAGQSGLSHKSHDEKLEWLIQHASTSSACVTSLAQSHDDKLEWLMQNALRANACITSLSQRVAKLEVENAELRALVACASTKVAPQADAIIGVLQTGTDTSNLVIDNQHDRGRTTLSDVDRTDQRSSCDCKADLASVARIEAGQDDTKEVAQVSIQQPSLELPECSTTMSDSGVGKGLPSEDPDEVVQLLSHKVGRRAQRKTKIAQVNDIKVLPQAPVQTTAALNRLFGSAQGDICATLACSVRP